MKKSGLWRIVKKYAVLIGEEGKNIYVIDSEREISELGGKIKQIYNELVDLFLSDDIYLFAKHHNPVLVITSLSKNHTRDEFSTISPTSGLEVHHSTREFTNFAILKALAFKLYEGMKLSAFLIPGILEPKCAKYVALEKGKDIIGLNEDMEKFVVHSKEKAKETQVISLDEFMKKYTIKPAIRLPSFKKLV